MGFISRLFGKRKRENKNIHKRLNQPDVIDVRTKDEQMAWAIEKSKLTLHYFEKCLKSPTPNQQVFSIKVLIEDEGKIEHIWLNSPSFDEEGNLFGVVGNVPIEIKSVSLNQKIGIDRNLISDWMIIENGRLIGGYTIRAIRDNLKGSELINFDKGLGGMTVDEGEDHFPPSNSTPEGAIVQLEEAYNNDDLKQVLSCKDFFIEAELMMAKLLKNKSGKASTKIPSELINNTAEAIKLSFIKSLQDNGMPKFQNVKRSFPKREKLNDKQLIITEILRYPDGSKTVQKLNTYKSKNGWVVLEPVNDNAIAPEKTSRKRDKSQNAEALLSQWLEHPDNYGVKPSNIELIESSSFDIRFVAGISAMKYSLFKYKMPNNEKEEIGIVDELMAWSYLDSIDYDKIKFEDLKMAYFGKLCENVHIKLQESTGGLMKYSKEAEINKIQNLFAKKGVVCEVIDIYKFNDDIIFYLTKITEKDGSIIYMPGHVSLKLNEYYMEKVIFNGNKAELHMALLAEFGRIMTKSKNIDG